MSKHKIAVCLYGRIGSPVGKWNSSTNINALEELTLKLGKMHWQKYLLDCNDGYEIDFFIHSWSKQLKKQIISAYNPKAHKIENQKFNFDVGKGYTNIGQISRLYSNLMVGKILKEYVKKTGTKYDQVILTRFDMAFRKEINLDELFETNPDDIKVLSGFYHNESNQPFHKFAPYRFSNMKNFNEYVDEEDKDAMVLYPNLDMETRAKIIDLFIASSYDNILTITKIYNQIKKDKNKIIYNTSAHVIYTEMIKHMIIKQNKGEIRILDGYYFANGRKGKFFSELINAPLVRQLYFNNSGCNGQIGDMVGKPYGRLVNIHRFLKENNVSKHISRILKKSEQAPEIEDATVTMVNKPKSKKLKGDGKDIKKIKKPKKPVKKEAKKPKKPEKKKK